jgi:hypothetical protein
VDRSRTSLTREHRLGRRGKIGAAWIATCGNESIYVIVKEGEVMGWGARAEEREGQVGGDLAHRVHAGPVTRVQDIQEQAKAVGQLGSAGSRS